MGNFGGTFGEFDCRVKSSKKGFKVLRLRSFKEKFPLELVDFIFFDGEIERGSIISNSKKIKKVFELTFDLDILYNISVDTKKVATRMVKKVGSDEVNKFDNLYKSYIELNSLMDTIEDKRAKQSKSLRIINELIRLNELKIRNRSREIQDIQDKIDDNSQKLSEEIETFYKINLYQLPLLMNRELFKKLDRDKSQIIEILEKRDFEDRFNLFLENCNIKSDNLELLKKFYNIMDVDSQIKLEFSREDLINSLERLKDLTGRKKELERKLNDIKIKLRNRDNLKKLEEKSLKLNRAKERLELKLNALSEELEKRRIEYKEIGRTLQIEFLTKRDKYSKIKSIEQLHNISDVAKEIYYKKLNLSLKNFNNLFRDKIEPFLEIYKHISKIYLDDRFKVILEDRKGSILDISLLSAGQKQILSFILINTILDFKRFIDFIFIDTPFGRLSNNSRDFIFFNYYLKFSNITLLITSSEYDYLKDKGIEFKMYEIVKNNYGSAIYEVKNG